MTPPSASDASARHWHRDDLVTAVLGALERSGLDVDRLSVDDLAATDQFHGGGRSATLRLAELAGLNAPVPSPRRVLDVGGGFGGPARTLAAHYGCEVTAVDLTPSYIEVANVLTERVGLAGQVSHHVGDALSLPFDDEQFDVVWTQNSGMNIADKAALYAGFHRVLRPGGTLAFQEPMAGEVSPPHYPLMWAEDPSLSFLASPDELRALIAGLGFDEREWQLVTESASSGAAPPPPPHAVQLLVMGAEHLREIQAASRRNVAEGRIAMVHAVFVKH